jgi:hypothetical protein
MDDSQVGWADCGYTLLQRNEKTFDGLNCRIRDLPRLRNLMLRGSLGTREFPPLERTPFWKLLLIVSRSTTQRSGCRRRS